MSKTFIPNAVIPAMVEVATSTILAKMAYPVIAPKSTMAVRI